MTDERVAAKTIPCLCPRCQKRHKQRIFFTGSGTPRLYCYDCKNYFQKYDLFGDITEWSSHDKESNAPDLSQFDYLSVPTVQRESQTIRLLDRARNPQNVL